MIDVDIDDVVEHGRVAVRMHRRLPDVMVGIVSRAAAEERSSHAYRNRTGDLQASTQAVESAHAQDLEVVDLVMGEEYASHVVARGFSNIEELEARAEQALSAEVGDMTTKTSG